MDCFVNQLVPEILQTTGQDLELDDILGDENVSNFFGEIQDSMIKCENGEFGETAQYYVQYIKPVEQQRLLHYAIKTNDYEMQLGLWKTWMPLCFATNHVHYGRYGTYYIC